MVEQVNMDGGRFIREAKVSCTRVCIVCRLLTATCPTVVNSPFEFNIFGGGDFKPICSKLHSLEKLAAKSPDLTYYIALIVQ